jgi:hypothetical protein
MGLRSTDPTLRLGYTQEKSDLIFLTLPRRITLMGKRHKIFVMAGLTLGGLLLIGSPAGAQTYYHPPSDQREYYQQQRIQQGLDSGALTQGEARYLEKEQARIQATEDRMRADGRLSPWERQRLRQMQNQANRTSTGWTAAQPRAGTATTTVGAITGTPAGIITPTMAGRVTATPTGMAAVPTIPGMITGKITNNIASSTVFTPGPWVRGKPAIWKGSKATFKVSRTACGRTVVCLPGNGNG